MYAVVKTLLELSDKEGIEVGLISISLEFNREKLLSGTSKIGHINDFNPQIDTNLQFNRVPYDLDLMQSYDGNASVINNYSYNTNKRFLDSELDNNVFGIGLN